MQGRFIPACAGNSARNCSSSARASVHPRVCGEQLEALWKYSDPGGSSPRVRGTDRTRSPQHLLRRFIPACAGNSRLCAFSSITSTVHPRVCGEQSYSPPSIARDDGSSPRVRGTVKYGHPVRFEFRFIPACAGNRQGFVGSRDEDAVHPRVCGEQCKLPGLARRTGGSSPRVRGTGFQVPGASLSSRFIPACAGNRHTGLLSTVVTTVHPRVCGEQHDIAEKRL